MVAVERDDDELARRRHHGLGALPNRRALQVLLSMPTGVAVPVTFLRSVDLRLLLSLPTGVVDLDGTDVRVALRPAVSLLSVGVVARTWKQGLEGVSPFASYCARYVVLDGGRDQQARGFCVAEARFRCGPCSASRRRRRLACRTCKVSGHSVQSRVLADGRTTDGEALGVRWLISGRRPQRSLCSTPAAP